MMRAPSTSAHLTSSSPTRPPTRPAPPCSTPCIYKMPTSLKKLFSFGKKLPNTCPAVQNSTTITTMSAKRPPRSMVVCSIVLLTAIYPISTASRIAQPPNTPRSTLCTISHTLPPGMSTKHAVKIAAPNQRIASVWLRWRSCSTLDALCFEDVLFPFAEDARDFVLDLEPELRVFLAADDFAPLLALEALPFAVLCFLPAKINLRIINHRIKAACR